MAVLTISRQFGAGGTTLGKKMAEQLGYIFINDEIISMVAQKAKVSADWVKAVEREAGGKLQKFIGAVVPRGLVDRILDDRQGYIDEEIYVDLLSEIINKIADEGKCVILGRGGQYILKDRKDTYHVLLIANETYRVQFMEKHYNLSRNEAIRAITVEDKRRTNLYRKIGRADYDRPEHYHLTLNMSRVNLDTATGIVQSLILGSSSPAKAKP